MLERGETPNGNTEEETIALTDFNHNKILRYVCVYRLQARFGCQSMSLYEELFLETNLKKNTHRLAADLENHALLDS